jgi:hypothetical protein
MRLISPIPDVSLLLNQPVRIVPIIQERLKIGRRATKSIHDSLIAHHADSYES